jgi:outer membrane receptor protein involved in Fe transport
VGNLSLVPEKANNTEVGVVYQPEFIPGFSISTDYWRVAIKGQIATPTSQQIIDLCQLSGNKSYCSFFDLTGAIGSSNPPYVLLVPFNVASVVTDGFDIESSYQFDLQDWDVPGSFSARMLASRASKYITDSGIPGQAITETAGTSADPHWKINMSQTWRGETMSFSVTERWFSNGVANPYGIVCAAGTCPKPDAIGQHPTYAPDSFKTPGNLFIDIGATYKLTPATELYVKVDNLDDRLSSARPVAGAGDDPIGRQYRVGLRFTN